MIILLVLQFQVANLFLLIFLAVSSWSWARWSFCQSLCKFTKFWPSLICSLHTCSVFFLSSFGQLSMVFNGVLIPQQRQSPWKLDPLVLKVFLKTPLPPYPLKSKAFEPLWSLSLEIDLNIDLNNQIQKLNYSIIRKLQFSLIGSMKWFSNVYLKRYISVQKLEYFFQNKFHIFKLIIMIIRYTLGSSAWNILW